jgi:N-acetyl-anhydromuramyl-L-alanine amidase AmpD
VTLLSSRGLLAAGLSAVLITGFAAARPASAQAAPTLQQEFAAAASESGVPEPLLLAVSYALTRWDGHGGRPSASGGYGLMHLTERTAEQIRDESGRGADVQADEAGIASAESLHRLTAAARLIGEPAGDVESGDEANLRAGAALLADRARTLGQGELPANLAGWYPAVAWFGGSPQASGANAFADDVYQTLTAGVTSTTREGETLTLPATPVALAKTRALTADAPAPECPEGLKCRFIPAAYQWTNHANPNAYGNYDPADRPADGNTIRYIVIHDTESSYDSTINSAQNPWEEKASHYVIRSSDGEVTQLIRTKDVGWHAANWNINSQSIGIEHEGHAAEGGWYTEAMYQASAKLVRYLAAKYRIPLDRTHIVGHEDVEADSPKRVAGAHWDPGPLWDWNHYMDLLHSPAHTDGGRVRAGDVVTISPDFATNLNGPIPACSPRCTTVDRQPTNFLYLHTEPREDAPLISDPALQPHGEPGKVNAEDWGNKAVSGRQYVAAEIRGDWVAIWYGGQKAWVSDPSHRAVRRSCWVLTVTPAWGLTSIPVYGAAFPTAAEYPAGIPAQVGAPLQYTVPAGQRYVAGELLRANNYYARADESGVPGNHTLVRGADRYLRISLNHRWAFVKLSDIRIG